MWQNTVLGHVFFPNQCITKVIIRNYLYSDKKSLSHFIFDYSKLEKAT